MDPQRHARHQRRRRSRPGRRPPATAGVNVGTLGDGEVQRADGRRAVTPRAFKLRTHGRESSRRPSPTTPATSIATLTPQSALQLRRDLQRHRQGRRGGVTDLAGNPLAADVTWSFSTEASPPPILVVGSPANPFGAYIGEILRNEGLQRVHDDRRLARLRPRCSRSSTSSCSATTPLTPAQATTLTELGQRRRQPDRDAAGQAARGLLGLTDAGTTLVERLPAGRHRHRAGRRHRRQHDPVPRHRRPLHAERRDRRRDAVLERDDGDHEPGGDAAQRRRERRPGGGVHVRPRALGRLHAPGQPGLGGPGARRRRRRSARTTSSTAPGRRRAARLDRHDKIAIPQADEQQRLLANLITVMDRDRMPLPRFWYLPRGEKAAVVMTGDDHRRQGPAAPPATSTSTRQLSPAGCSVADWECVRSTSYIYPERTLTNAQAAAYKAEGFEVGAAPPGRRPARDRADHGSASWRRSTTAARRVRRRSTRALPPR